MDRKIIAGIIVLVVLMLPFIDGLIAKRVITQQVQTLARQAEITEGKSISIAEYKVGWLSSTITFNLHDSTGTTQLPPVKLKHGPIVFAFGKPKFALASIFVEQKIPHGMDAFVTTTKPYLMQYNAIFSLNMKTVYNYLRIADFSIVGTYMNFGGMILTMDMTFNSDTMTRYKTTTSIGETSMVNLPDIADLPNLKTGVINVEFDATYDKNNLWLGTLKGDVAALNWTSDAGVNVVINNLKYKLQSDITDNKYNGGFNLTSDSLQTNMPGYAINTLNQLTLVTDFKNMNPAGIVKLRDVDDDNSTPIQRALNFLSLFTPSSTAHIKAAAMTNLGAFDVDINVMLQGLPSMDHNFIKNINADINARINTGIVSLLLAGDELQKLTQAGYLIQDKTDYIIKFNKQGDKALLNGKDVSDFVNQPETAIETYNKSVNPPAPAAAPAAPPT